MLRSFLNRIFAEGPSRGAINGGIGARSKFRRNPRRVYLGLLCLWGAVSAVFGHNLYISSTEVYFADDFLATMTSRASSHQSLIQVGDEFWLVQKGTPGPGTTLGVGGYLTFYVPTGYQVVDAAYVTPCSTSTDSRGFTTIPIKGQGSISVGSGKTENSALTTSELIGYTYPAANVLGVRESPVTSAGLNRGTIAGVYADTGIFYSVSSRTAYTTSLAALGNKAGDSVVPLNLFDSDQERAFGLAQNAILNSTGGGNTPWGMGSAVAGPESGYAWCFDYAVYNATSGSATVKGQAATTVGPWNRIRYAGSQISKDIAGNTDTTIGYAGVSAGTIGYNFATAGALPTTVNAVRFSVGQLQLGLPEYVAIKVKTTASFSSLSTIVGEALGGDAAGVDVGKDNLWKYYNPTISTATPSALLQKKAANSLLATNGTTYFDLTFANAGTNALTNVVIKDTLPVGLGYVSSTPTAASTTGGVITWNLGVVSNGAVQTLKLNVRATNTLGILTNTVTASATGKTNLATAYDTVVVTNLAYLTLNKTVASPTVPPGGTNRYTVTVSNVGNVTNGIPLVITDSLPSGFSYVAFISASLNGTNYVATNSFISVSTSNVAEPVFTINRAISPNQSCVITFDAKVSTTNALGTYYNQAEMTYGSVSLPPTPLAPVTVQSNTVLSWSSISPLVYGVAITTNNALYPTSNVPGSFTFAPTNGSILPVGTNSLVANFTPSNTTSYASGTITNTVVITKAILTTTCQPTNKVYGQTNPPLSYLLTGFVNGENSNSLTTQPVASTTVILSTPVGVYTNAITATGGTASNYSFTYVPANFTVTKAVSTVAMSGTTSFTYGGSAQGPDTSSKTGSTGGVTYSYSGTGGTSYGASATKPTAVGSYTATATLAADSNYDGAISSAYGFSISKAPSTISVTGLTSFTYSGVSQGPGTSNKTGSSGAVTYSYSGAGGTSYGASATKPTAVGSYTATATLAADVNYNGAVSTPYSFSIGKAPSTISVTGLTSFTYNTNAQGPDSNAKTGSSGAVTFSYSGTGLTSYGPSPTKPTDVGSYEATATLAADSNYDGATSSAYGFSIGKDGSTISVTGLTSFTYSGASQGPDTSNKTGSSGAVTYSYSGAGGTIYLASATKPTDVGSYEATASLAPDSNYDGATSTAYGFSIVKDGSTISVTGLSSFTYNTNAQGPDSNAKTGSSGAVTYSYSGAGGTSYGASATKPTDVGSYEATASLAPDSNYDGATSTAYGFSIGKAPSTINVTGLTSFTYSGASQGPDTSNKTGSTGGVTYGYAGTGLTSYGPIGTKPTEVGSYTATASLAADSNYDGATSTAYGFTILAKPITITADPKSKISGDSDPTLTSQFTVGSIELGDALSGSLNRVEGETPGKYAITSTFSNGNYAITFVSADLTILDGVNPNANEDRLVPVPIKTSKFHVLEVLANDTDLLKRSLTVTAVSALSEHGGTVELRGGWILYTPPPGLASGVEDSFTYTLFNGVGSAQGTVYLLAAEWAMTDAMNILSVTDSAPGKVVTFSAIPNFVYEVFATSSLAPANWVKLGDYTADAQGILRVNDVAAGSSRFYRTRSQP